MHPSDYIQLEKEYGAHNYSPLDVVIERGDGVWVFDVEGKKYLDCLSSYSAVNQGHVHPVILKAMIDQASKVTLVSRAFRNDQLPLWYQDMSRLTGFNMALPMNTGAEAVETALKIARKWAYVCKNIPRYQAEIIIASGNFHGRTISIVSFSTEDLYKKDFGPFTPGFKVCQYGNYQELESLVTKNTAAVLIEPIQGEGGVIVPPEGYLKQISRLCKKENILLLLDEIQTGLGRTGKMFAFEYDDVRPDILILGKALSGGFYPVSAIAADKSILGLFSPGEHGSTFGGSPLAARVSRAAISVLFDENMVDNSAKMGHYFMACLKEINSKHIKEVRGKGLMIGVELYPEAGGARKFCEALMSKGILCKETHQNVIRLTPPLIIQKSTIDWALDRIREVLSI